MLVCAEVRVCVCGCACAGVRVIRRHRVDVCVCVCSCVFDVHVRACVVCVGVSTRHVLDAIVLQCLAVCCSVLQYGVAVC